MVTPVRMKNNKFVVRRNLPLNKPLTRNPNRFPKWENRCLCCLIPWQFRKYDDQHRHNRAIDWSRWHRQAKELFKRLNWLWISDIVYCKCNRCHYLPIYFWQNVFVIVTTLANPGNKLKTSQNIIEECSRSHSQQGRMIRNVNRAFLWKGQRFFKLLYFQTFEHLHFQKEKEIFRRSQNIHKKMFE